MTRPGRYRFLGIVRFKRKGRIWFARTNIREYTWDEASFWVLHRYHKAWENLAAYDRGEDIAWQRSER